MSARSTPGPESHIGHIEQALSRIVTWATRNDVQQKTMRDANCDLPRAHIWLLARLNSYGPARLSDLAASLGVDNSTLTPQAQRLERDGLIVRTPDPADGRASLLLLTRAGKSLLNRLHATRRAVFAELLAGWPASDQAQAARLLVELAAVLEASMYQADKSDPDAERPLAAASSARRR